MWPRRDDERGVEEPRSGIASFARRDIAVFLPSLGGGGAERVVVHLVKEFRRRGIDAEIVVAGKVQGGAYIDPEFPVRELGAGRVASSLVRLIAYLRETRPHCLMTTLAHANVVAIVANWLAGGESRLVAREANMVSAGRSTGWRGRIVASLQRILYRHLNAVIAVSNGVADDLTRETGVPSTRVKVVRNPIDTAMITEKAARNEEHDCQSAHRRPFVLAVGRLSVQKDYPTLINAFAAVRTRRDARLVILGEGPLRPELEQLIGKLGLAEFVDLPGFISNPYALMAQASVFVLSSRWEGLPNALIEAMACGARVVATDCPSGPRELLEDGRLGRLVSVGDVQELADTIVDELGRPKRPDVASYVLERYRVGSVATEYLEVLLPGRQAR